MEASMSSRLDEPLRYSARSCLMAAATYNRIRLALLRLGNPLRLSLTGLRTLEMVLEKDAWVCVDASLNDHPILAWVQFQVADRKALHEAVECRLFTYHAHAELMESQVIEKTAAMLRHRLRKLAEGEA